MAHCLAVAAILDFVSLVANAQGEIQGTSSMLLRWVLIQRNDVFMFIVSQAVM